MSESCESSSFHWIGLIFKAKCDMIQRRWLFLWKSETECKSQGTDICGKNCNIAGKASHDPDPVVRDKLEWRAIILLKG